MVAVEIGEHGVEFDPLAHVTVHPAAEMFPMLQPAELNELMDDIKEYGLREPIVFTPDGQLLDGRNRYRACRKLGDEPPRRVERSEPWSYVISTNLRRRHLSDNERQMIGARIAERTQGRPENRPDGRISEQRPPTQEQVAELLNVSERGIRRARKVVTDGIKPLQRAVEQNEVSVSKASEIASLPPEEQQEIVERIKQGERPASVVPDVERQRKRLEKRGSDKTYYTRSEVLSRETLIRLSSTLGGIATGVKEIKSLSPDLTAEEARAFARDIRNALTDVRNLVRVIEQHKEAAA